MDTEHNKTEHAIHPAFLVAAAILCSLPVLIPDYPPMVDLPQHLASIMVLHNVHFGDYAFAELFTFNWFRPYWLAYGLIWAGTPLFGLIASAKLVICIALSSFVITCALFRREVRAPAVLDWLFLTVPFGFAFEWGFLSFMIACPLGVLFLKQYHRYLKGKVPTYQIIIWVNMLFFAHALTMVFMCAAAGFMSFKTKDSFKALFFRVLPLASGIPITLAWLYMDVSAANPSSGGPWDLSLKRIFDFLPAMFSLSTSWQNTFLSLFLISCPFLLGAKISRQPGNIFPFLFYAAFMLLAPNYLFGNYFTYNRFHFFGLLFFVLLFSQCRFSDAPHFHKSRRLFTIAIPCISITIIGFSSFEAFSYNKESSGFKKILAHMDPEQRALGLIQFRQSFFYQAPTYLHYPVWYQVEKKGLVDFNFAITPTMNTTYKDEYRPINTGVEWFPQHFNWELQNADVYRYFVLNGHDDFVKHVFRDDHDKVKLVTQHNYWRLYENVNWKPENSRREITK